MYTVWSKILMGKYIDEFVKILLSKFSSNNCSYGTNRPQVKRVLHVTRIGLACCTQ